MQFVAVEGEAALVAVVGIDPQDLAARLVTATTLRSAGLDVRPDGSERKLGRQLEAAAKAGARWAVIVGAAGVGGSVGLKDLGSGEQESVALESVPSRVLR